MVACWLRTPHKLQGEARLDKPTLEADGDPRSGSDEWSDAFATCVAARMCPIGRGLTDANTTRTSGVECHRKVTSTSWGGGGLDPRGANLADLGPKGR